MPIQISPRSFFRSRFTVDFQRILKAHLRASHAPAVQSKIGSGISAINVHLCEIG
jgi:hypothetical protein